MKIAENTLKCSVCGKEYNVDIEPEKIALFDARNNYCVCEECFEIIAKKHYQAVMANGKNVQVNLNDPLEKAKIEADNELKKVDILTNLKKIIQDNTPETLKKHLDEYVVGQERAKEIISTAVYNHYKRVLFMDQLKIMKNNKQEIPPEIPDEIQKSNCLIVGSSGVGKTMILRTIAKFLDVPFTIVDSSTLTEAGFVGADVETAVRQLWQEADCDIERTEHGIIFLDEFDKLARKSGKNNMITADPSHEGVQQALLKMVEGGVVSFTQGQMRRNPDAPTIQVDTTNILFIAGGAFDGIVDMIKQRVDNVGLLGFNMNKKKSEKSIDNLDDECSIYNHYIDQVTPEDFLEFGIIPELLGRLPVLCPLHQLDKNDLINILTNPRNAFIKQYRMLYSVMDKANLIFENEAIEAIADKAIEAKTGARGLRTIIEKHLNDSMFRVPTIRRNNPDKDIVIQITKDCVLNNENPAIEVKDKVAAN